MEYKDLVRKLLVQDANQRLPLIRIFVHPWVMHFQKKHDIKRAPTPQYSDDDEDYDASEYSSESQEDDEDDC